MAWFQPGTYALPENGKARQFDLGWTNAVAAGEMRSGTNLTKLARAGKLIAWNEVGSPVCHFAALDGSIAPRVIASGGEWTRPLALSFDGRFLVTASPLTPEDGDNRPQWRLQMHQTESGDLLITTDEWRMSGVSP